MDTYTSFLVIHWLQIVILLLGPPYSNGLKKDGIIDKDVTETYTAIHHLHKFVD
jgi:hypothetical protein